MKMSEKAKNKKTSNQLQTCSSRIRYISEENLDSSELKYAGIFFYLPVWLLSPSLRSSPLSA